MYTYEQIVWMDRWMDGGRGFVICARHHWHSPATSRTRQPLVTCLNASVGSIEFQSPTLLSIASHGLKEKTGVNLRSCLKFLPVKYIVDFEAREIYGEQVSLLLT